MSDEPVDDISALRNAAVTDVLGAHLFGLIQLAAVRLGESPPRLEDAALVIDVAAALVAAGGERLCEHRELYRNALAEIQQVYVRASAP